MINKKVISTRGKQNAGETNMTLAQHINEGECTYLILFVYIYCFLEREKKTICIHLPTKVKAFLIKCCQQSQKVILIHL